jgi:hypothetical protein
VAPGKQGPADYNVYVRNDKQFSPCKKEKMRMLGSACSFQCKCLSQSNLMPAFVLAISTTWYLMLVLKYT